MERRKKEIEEKSQQRLDKELDELLDATGQAHLTADQRRSKEHWKSLNQPLPRPDNVKLWLECRKCDTTGRTFQIGYARRHTNAARGPICKICNGKGWLKPLGPPPGDSHTAGYTRPLQEQSLHSTRKEFNQHSYHHRCKCRDCKQHRTAQKESNTAPRITDPAKATLLAKESKPKPYNYHPQDCPCSSCAPPPSNKNKASPDGRDRRPVSKFLIAACAILFIAVAALSYYVSDQTQEAAKLKKDKQQLTIQAQEWLESWNSLVTSYNLVYAEKEDALSQLEVQADSRHETTAPNDQQQETLLQLEEAIKAAQDLNRQLTEDNKQKDAANLGLIDEYELIKTNISRLKTSQTSLETELQQLQEDIIDKQEELKELTTATAQINKTVNNTSNPTPTPTTTPIPTPVPTPTIPRFNGDCTLADGAILQVATEEDCTRLKQVIGNQAPTPAPTPSPTAAPTPTPTPATPTAATTPKQLIPSLDAEIIGDLVFDYTNEERAKRNLPPFTRDTDIDSIAAAHSQDMAITGNYSHRINGQGPSDRARSAGYNCKAYQPDGSYTYGLAENIHKVQRIFQWTHWSTNGVRTHTTVASYISNDEAMARELVKDWMQSLGHRANIISASAKRIGIGIYIKNEVKHGWNLETVFATQNFSDCRESEL